MPSAISSLSFCRSCMTCSTVSLATTPRSAPSSCSVVKITIASSCDAKRSAARRTWSGVEPIFTSATPVRSMVTPLMVCAVGSNLICRERSDTLSERCVSLFTKAPRPLMTVILLASPSVLSRAFLPTMTMASSALGT